MPTNRDPKTGKFCKGEPVANTASNVEPDTVRNYVVPVPNFFMWPVHVVAWLFATVVRFVALVLLVVALVALYGWWAGDGSQSCPVAPAAYHAAIRA